MNLNDKKGVSGIVTVVLLILVAITAVALIAAFLIPFIKGSLTESQECFEVLGKVDVVPGQFTCLNATSNEVQVRIKRGFTGDAEISSLAVVFAGGGQSKRYDLVPGGTPTSIRELSGDYEDSLNLPGEGEENTYVFNVSTMTSVDTVEVSPVVSSEKVCEATLAAIPSCSA